MIACFEVAHSGIAKRGPVWALATAVALLVPIAALAAGLGIDSGATAVDRADRGDEQVQVNPPPATFSATYRITLDVAWTASTHPGTVPGNAHVSPAVVAVHGSNGAMFVVGGLASNGLEAMAERGSTGALVAELNGTAAVSTVQVGSTIFGSGTNSFVVELTQNSELISLVTMLAPSPDWFTGFADRDLFVGGQWVDGASFPLGNYDAGTDSGGNFTSGNADTQPAQTISGPRDATFVTAASQNPFGSITITRIG